jgi:N-acetylneuraminic acid mutarotase
MKKIIMFLIATFTSSFSILKAQGVWSPVADFPDTGRYGGISFSIGNYGYIGLGFNPYKAPQTWNKDFWQFDPSTDIWTQKANFPGKARFCPASFVIGNKAYVVTGNDSALRECVTECWQYNPVTNAWAQKANFPGSPRAYDVGFTIGGKGYVGTGSKVYQDYCKDFYAYDTATDTWTRIADFGGTARFSASGFSAGDKGYICFGEDSLFNFYTDMWEYNTATNVWTQEANYPADSVYGMSGFVVGNNIYVGAGQKYNGYCDNKFWEYNTIANSWNEESSVPLPLRCGCYSFAVGDTGYLGLGFPVDAHDNVCPRSFYKFFPDSTPPGSDTATQLSLLIYPNPFNSYCIIALPENAHPIFSLYDIIGRKIEPDITSMNSYYILNKNTLSAGMYILSVKYNSEVVNKKLIVIN